MSVGDGSAWDETNPTNSTLATSIDDYDRDLRIGVRSRMQAEHEWPSSQSATNQAGQHKFVTMQNQATKPTVSGTQLAAIYTKTVGSGLQELFWENEAGSEVQLTNRSNMNNKILNFAMSFTTAVYSSVAANWTVTAMPSTTGGQVLHTYSYSPITSGNQILVEGFSPVYVASAGGDVILALFSGTVNADAASAFGDPGAVGQLTVTKVYTATGSGAITFTLRGGGDYQPSGFNQAPVATGGGPLFGTGNSMIFIKVTEYKP